MSEAITITNHTGRVIEIETTLDLSVVAGDRKKTISISPKDTHVIFIECIESLCWNKDTK